MIFFLLLLLLRSAECLAKILLHITTQMYNVVVKYSLSAQEEKKK